ncbi:MAG: DUF4271 domain-containing protein [Alistipes sp.]|nr:DUF4271 domain-containing protein [Alistipes sp.]
MNNDTLTYFEESGYKVVTPARLYGRKSEVQMGEPNLEGNYREVTPEELYGETSELGTGGTFAPYDESLTATPLFQSVVLATLIVYLAILLRSWGFIRSIWNDAFKTNSDQRMVFEGGELPLQRFKLMASLLGLAVTALAMVRIAESEIPTTSEIYSSAIASYSPLVALGAILIIVLWCFAYHRLMAWIIESDSPNALAMIGYTNFVRLVVLLYPITAMWLLADGRDSSAYSITLIICSSVLLLLYLKDTFVFFLGKKISIFYWILYLCTAILLPWSLFVKLLASQITP